jgi:hypothetical protein
VRVSGGKGGDVLSTDGPYAESKEVLTGFFLLECADLDEAIALAAQIPAAWNGAVEVRPVIPMGAPPPAADADPQAALVALVRDEGRRVLATLVRTTGSWELARTRCRTPSCGRSRPGPATASRPSRGPG